MDHRGSCWYGRFCNLFELRVLSKCWTNILRCVWLDRMTLSKSKTLVMLALLATKWVTCLFSSTCSDGGDGLDNWLTLTWSSDSCKLFWTKWTFGFILVPIINRSNRSKDSLQSLKIRELFSRESSSFLMTSDIQLICSDRLFERYLA